MITVAASPATLWPPNGKLVDVMVSGTVRDEPDSSVVQASTYQVTDEYGQVHPSGSFWCVRESCPRIWTVLTFPISEFGLCSCGFLIHPL
jgi:hypothetical protein